MRRTSTGSKWVDHADRAGEPKDGDNDHAVSEGKHGEVGEVGKHGTPFHMFRSNRGGREAVEWKGKRCAKGVRRGNSVL